MTSGLIFIIAIVAMAVAILWMGRIRQRNRRVDSDHASSGNESLKAIRHDPGQIFDRSQAEALSEEARSEAELERLQGLIRDRKQIAWKSDISHHLWNLYKNQFRSSAQSSDRNLPEGKWYDLKFLQASSGNGQNCFEFELNGVRYTFIDDEEKQGWCENMKYFSLYLYDDSDHCLIEVPIKLRVDRWGSNYSVSSESPTAFLPGDWINDFIKTTLKHQSIRNQEIRAQKHQERLWEIKELKDRFGISD